MTKKDGERQGMANFEGHHIRVQMTKNLLFTCSTTLKETTQECKREKKLDILSTQLENIAMKSLLFVRLYLVKSVKYKNGQFYPFSFGVAALPYKMAEGGGCG